MIAALSERVRQIEGTRRTGGAEVVSSGAVSSGTAALDGLLPAGGFRRGSLVELLSESAGSGAGTLALLAARQAAGDEGTVVVVDREGLFYPPAAARLGIDLVRLIVVRPTHDEDHAWALDQALRCPGVAAVWCSPGEPGDHALRRWQLAVETSGVLGLVLRSTTARQTPHWADVRLLVEPIASDVQKTHWAGKSADRVRRLRVELLNSRQARGAIELEISPHAEIFKRRRRQSERHQQEQPTMPQEANHETRPVHLASQLAPPKARRRARGA
jgi:hypothetical protein